MMNNFVDYNELSRGARRALEKEREKRMESVHEVDEFLQMLELTDELVSNANELAIQLERQKEENETLRQQLQEEKEARAKVEMQLNEMSKLSAGVAKKSSQDDVLKAIRTYLNISKRKTLSKREAAKTVLLDLFTSTRLDLPDDIKELLTYLDDEQPEAKVVNVQGNYNDIHDNGAVNNKE